MFTGFGNRVLCCQKEIATVWIAIKSPMSNSESTLVVSSENKRFAEPFQIKIGPFSSILFLVYDKNEYSLNYSVVLVIYQKSIS